VVIGALERDNIEFLRIAMFFATKYSFGRQVMAEYVYTTVTGKIKPLLGKLRTVGVPPKVTAYWLKTIGFTSSNDAGLSSVLKFIGLTDASNIPTPTWSTYQRTNQEL
jgi:hypothetical protein